MDDLPEQIRRWSEAAASNALPPVTAEEVTGSSIPEPRPNDDRPARRWRAAVAAAAAAILAVGAGAALWDRDADRTERVTAAAPDVDPDGATAAIDVRLEPVNGIFTEGFEVGLRFETADGTEIASTLWSDAVPASNSTDVPDFYGFVLRQPVPAGEPLVLRAEVTIGAAGGPAVPDLDGPLPCRLDLDLAEGTTAVVEVALGTRPAADGAGCLRLVETIPEGQATSTTTPEGKTTTGVPLEEAATTSTTTTVPSTTTTGPVGRGAAPAVGSAQYVDVDLVCEAFDLSGTWVVESGDPSSWQPPGERHEGGTFTIDDPTHGTFRGDAAGTKVATFRLIGPAEEPACRPVPR